MYTTFLLVNLKRTDHLGDIGTGGRTMLKSRSIIISLNLLLCSAYKHYNCSFQLLSDTPMLIERLWNLIFRHSFQVFQLFILVVLLLQIIDIHYSQFFSKTFTMFMIRYSPFCERSEEINFSHVLSLIFYNGTPSLEKFIKFLKVLILTVTYNIRKWLKCEATSPFPNF